MGPAAAPAVPDLVAGIRWLEGTEKLELQFTLSSFIIALGHIGPDAAASVPVLAELHYAYPTEKWFDPAWSIAQITEQDWPDADVKFEWDQGAAVLPFDQVLQEDLYGENYLITLAALEWWETEGQYQSWPPLGE